MIYFFSRCPFTTCTVMYIGETDRPLGERERVVEDHRGRGTKSHILRFYVHYDHVKYE